jgi:hypothetical protein
MDIEKSIGQVPVIFTCGNCSTKTKTIWFEVFAGADDEPDILRLAKDIDNYMMLCMHCLHENRKFTADYQNPAV